MLRQGSTGEPSGSGLTGPPRDMALGLGMIAFSVLLHLWLIPWQVNDQGSFGVPPSFAPKVLAWIILALGVVLVLANAHRIAVGEPAKDDGPRLTGKNLLFLALCIGTTALMLTLMRLVGEKIGQPYAGFLVAAPSGLVAYTLIHGQARAWAYAFNAIVIPCVIYVSFRLGLGLPLP